MSELSLRYDASIIEQFARNLYRKAELVTTGSIVAGSVIGAAFGAVPLTSLGESWPISRTFGFATFMLGGLVGAAVGYVIGDARAFGYRLHAQVAICQIEIERTTSETARAVAALAAASARPPTPAPAPV